MHIFKLDQQNDKIKLVLDDFDLNNVLDYQLKNINGDWAELTVKMIVNLKTPGD